jgi:hypothetical protein
VQVADAEGGAVRVVDLVVEHGVAETDRV